MNTETRVVKLTVITDFVRPTFILALVPPSNSPSLFVCLILDMSQLLCWRARAP